MNLKNKKQKSPNMGSLFFKEEKHGSCSRKTWQWSFYQIVTFTRKDWRIIITNSSQSAKYLREKAKIRGYSDKDIYSITDYIFRNGFRFRPNERLYIDNAEFVFQQWFTHTFYDDPERASVKLTAAITTKNDSDYLTAPVCTPFDL